MLVVFVSGVVEWRDLFAQRRKRTVVNRRRKLISAALIVRSEDSLRYVLGILKGEQRGTSANKSQVSHLESQTVKICLTDIP